jgi:hypothetical protein
MGVGLLQNLALLQADIWFKGSVSFYFIQNINVSDPNVTTAFVYLASFLLPDTIAQTAGFSGLKVVALLSAPFIALLGNRRLARRSSAIFC